MAQRSEEEIDLPHWGAACRAVLNGVIGDHLERSGNPLAIEMSFRRSGGEPRSAAVFSSRLVVLVHGLTNQETIFEFRDPEAGNYGIRLHRDFGFTPLFLRYNTGLPIEQNGRRFAELLEELVLGYPGPLDEIVLIGFSMGGLVTRLAQRFAREQDFVWLSKLSHCIYLGTPHEGARLEKFGRFVGGLLRHAPGRFGVRWADRVDVRSAGIRDLGDGLAGAPPDTFAPAASHHFVSGSLSGSGGSVVDEALGDGLVTSSSACPGSAPAGSSLEEMAGVSHFPLAYSESVYRKIAEWVGDGPPARVAGLEERFSLPGEDTDTPPLALLAGAIGLVGEAVEGVADSVKDVHLSIAGIPHRALGRVPGVRRISRGVEGTHRGIAGFVYGMVRGGGTLLRAASGLVGER